MTGIEPKRVIAELKEFYRQDQRYDDGKILCSMCTKTPPIAEKAYKLFLNSNLGDPGLFPGSTQLENEVVNELATLLHGENCVGHVVSGGTEANLLALLSARNRANIEEPEVILPQSAHFSFTKICNLLNLKQVYAGLDGSFSVDSLQVDRLVTKNTIAIVGTAGTSELGVIDPIERLSKIALKHNIWLHVDAAFGGLVLPFLDRKQDFDFALDAVLSMTVDPHKMGMAIIPAGGIIFRNSEALDYFKTETPYLTDHYQYTFIGTRAGAAAASAWAVFRSLGIEGFKKVVGNCLKITQLFKEGIQNEGFKLVVEPSLNIVTFRSNQNTKILADKLRQKGWFVSYVPRYDCIRIVVMPHVKKHHALSFLKDLKQIENL